MEIWDQFISLEGKVAMITGSGSGIGLAVSRLMAKYGAGIAMIDISKVCADEADKLCQTGAQAHFFPCDVSEETQVTRTVEAVMERFGRIDILVNNAAVMVRKTVVDATVEDWDRSMNIGLKGTFLCSKYVIPIMMEQKQGVIINTASGAAIKGVPDAAAYNAAKGGVTALTRSMAVDFGAYGIRVNCVCPGDIMTPMLLEEGIQTGKITTTAPRTQKEKEEMEQFLASCGSHRPLRRIATAEEIAYTFLFLATDMSAYATGGSFIVDGGRCS